MAIVELPVTILNDAELIDLGGRMDGAIGRLLPSHPWLGPLVTDVRTQITAMNLSRGRELGSELTDDLAAADVARDQVFLEFRTGLDYFRQKPDVAKRTAAENLLALIRRRDYSLQVLGDREQSVQLKALLADLATPAAQADLTTLGLTVEVTTLQQRQQAFDTLVDQRETADTVKKQIPALLSVRALLREDVSLIRDSLASAERREPATYAALAAEISEHITSVSTTAHARRTRRTGDNNPPPPPPNPNPGPNPNPIPTPPPPSPGSP